MYQYQMHDSKLDVMPIMPEQKWQLIFIYFDHVLNIIRMADTCFFGTMPKCTKFIKR